MATWHEDDSSTATVTITPNEGVADVGNIVHPASAKPGQTIQIDVPISNTETVGNESMIVRLHIYNPSTGQELGSYIESGVMNIAAGGSDVARFNVTVPSNWVETSIDFKATGHHLVGF